MKQRVKTGPWACSVLKVALLVFSLFGSAAWTPPEEPSTNEDTRSEELLQRRIKKSSALHPEAENSLKKALLYLESKRPDEIFSIRFKDFYPKFGNPTPSSGLGLGLRFYKARLGTTPLSVESSYLHSFSAYRVADLNVGKFSRLAPDFFVGPPEFGEPFTFGEPGPREVNRERLFAYGQVRYRYLPQEEFSGLGMNLENAVRSSYLQEDFLLNGTFGYQFNPWLAAGTRLGYRRYNIEPGTNSELSPLHRIYSDSEAPGILGQPDYSVFGGVVFVNLTDKPGNPHKGIAIGGGVDRFLDLEKGHFSFTRYTLDSRGYLPLKSPQRVLAVRFEIDLADPDSGAQVPFHLMPTLGGSALLRGFRELRFRDSNLVYLSGEYRWEPAPAFEMALFYDLGKVYPTGTSLGFNDLEDSYGFGFRFKTTRRTIIRLDFAWGQEGHRVQFRFGPAF